MPRCSICGKRYWFGKIEYVGFGFVEHYCKECSRLKMERSPEYYDFLDQREKAFDDLIREHEKERPNPLRHPEANKPYFHYCVEVNRKYYAGTVKDKSDGGYRAELYDDPFNPTKTTLIVEGKEKKNKIIRDDRGTVDCLVLYGDLKIEELI